MLGPRTGLPWAYCSPRGSGNATLYLSNNLPVPSVNSEKRAQSRDLFLWKTNTKTQDKRVLVMVTKSMINS